MMKFVNFFSFPYFFKRFMITYFAMSFFSHSFNCFLHVMPTPICPRTLPLVWGQCPHSGSILGMACSEHCGVLRTAWSNVDEAWGSQSGGSTPWTLARCLSKVQNGSVLLTCEYYSMLSIMFVATDERGPGGMRQITGMEDWHKVRKQVPWAGPPPPCAQEENWLFRIAFMYAVNVA